MLRIIIILIAPVLLYSQNKKELKEEVINLTDSLYKVNDSLYNLVLEIKKLKNSTENISFQLDKLQIERNDLIRKTEKLDNLNQSYLDSIDKMNLNIFSLNEDLIYYENKVDNYLIEISEFELLVDEYNNKNKYLISKVDSLLNASQENTISLKGLISDTKFRKSKMYGTWDLSTLVMEKQGEYIDILDLYSYDDDNYERVYDAKESIISTITFIRPNICTIELEDGDKISSVYEVNVTNSGYLKNIYLKCVNSEKNEFRFTISEYNGAYIFNYPYRDLINFFDRDDYNNGYTEHLRVKGVQYEYSSDYLDQYYINVVGIIK
tara:strand:+ start:4733 stop:5698 length:966 start_codon:yes stop_codon:yes gene_type:complete